MEYLLDPFLNNAFMTRALLAGVLVSIACAVVGTFVVLRGLAFIGDALAHGVLPGIAAAVLLGLPAMLGAALGAVVMIGGCFFDGSKASGTMNSSGGFLATHWWAPAGLFFSSHSQPNRTSK